MNTPKQDPDAETQLSRSVEQPTNVTTYVPENDPPSVRLTPKRSIAGIVIWTCLIGTMLFAWMQYRNESNLRNTENQLHDSELNMTEQQHKKEIDNLKHLHENQLTAREEVFNARLEQEHEKGFVADYITPWVDWFRGSDIEAEIETPAGGAGITIRPSEEK